jgi:hypothetical protein
MGDQLSRRAGTGVGLSFRIIHASRSLIATLLAHYTFGLKGCPHTRFSRRGNRSVHIGVISAKIFLVSILAHEWKQPPQTPRPRLHSARVQFRPNRLSCKRGLKLGSRAEGLQRVDRVGVLRLEGRPLRGVPWRAPWLICQCNAWANRVGLSHGTPPADSSGICPQGPHGETTSFASTFLYVPGLSLVGVWARANC